MISFNCFFEVLKENFNTAKVTKKRKKKEKFSSLYRDWNTWTHWDILSSVDLQDWFFKHVHHRLIEVISFLFSPSWCTTNAYLPKCGTLLEDKALFPVPQSWRGLCKWEIYMLPSNTISLLKSTTFYHYAKQLTKTWWQYLTTNGYICYV